MFIAASRRALSERDAHIRYISLKIEEIAASYRKRDKDLTSSSDTDIGKLAARLESSQLDASVREAQHANGLYTVLEQNQREAALRELQGREGLASALRHQAYVNAETLRAQTRANDEAVAVLKLEMDSRVAESQHPSPHSSDHRMRNIKSGNAARRPERLCPGICINQSRPRHILRLLRGP